MKQILLVLLFTGLVAVGFVVARMLSEDADPGPAVRPDPGRATGAIPAPGGVRPDVSGTQGPRPDGSQLPDGLTLRPDVEEKLRTLAGIDWKEGLSTERMVLPEEAWWPLDTPIDFEADVVARVGDVEITRERLRTYVCLRDGRPLLRARLIREMAGDDAARTAPEFTLPPNAFDRAFEARARSLGRTLEDERRALAFNGRMSEQASYESRRLLFESVLLALMPRALEGDFPASIAAPLSSSGAKPEQMMASIEETWAAVSDGEATDDEWNSLWGLVDLLGLHWGLSFEESFTTLTWTALDIPLPDGVVAQVATQVDPEEVGRTAPWLLGGAPVPVLVDDLWPLLEPGLSGSDLEASLLEVAWLDVLSQDLAREGLLPTAEEAWQSFYDELVASRETVMPFTFYKLELLGYPGFAQYRVHERIRAGYEQTPGGALPTEDELLDHYRANRTLFAGFQPSLEFAFFPSQSPVWGDGAFDRERARQEAAAFAQQAQVPGADFAQLAASHQSALREAYAQLPREQPRVLRFNAIYAAGKASGSVREVDKTLGLLPWDLDVSTSSIARSTLVELAPGQVSDPWAVDDGWLVVRLADARLLQLEPAFEDVRHFVEAGLREDRFREWANGVLRR